MNKISIITKKEILSFFSTSQAYIFIIAYLGFSTTFTFFIGNILETNNASLIPFLAYQPWLFLFFMPAITMKMWSDEHRLGTTEFLLTLPLDEKHIVLGKFFASWVISIIAITLNFPIWITLNILGNPDNSVIFVSYIGLVLLSGMYISIGLAISSLTSSQVVSFIITVTISFLILMSGTNFVLDVIYDFLPFLADFVSIMSSMVHYDNFIKGIIEVSSLFYFAISILFWLSINYFIILIKRG